MKRVPTLGPKPSRLRFSPDGNYLACNLDYSPLPFGFPDLTNDVFVVDVATGIAKRVVEHWMNEEFIGWTPNGSKILFTSDRRGTTDLWSLDVKNGETHDSPKMVKANLGELQPIGLTRTGSFFYTSEVSGSSDAYKVSVDFESGRTVSPPKLLQTIFHPKFMASSKIVKSQDGSLLFYCSGNSKPAAHILDIQTGETREIPNSSSWVRRNGWWWPSPDNKTIAVATMFPENDRGLHMLNTQNGELTPIALDSDDVRQITKGSVRFRFNRKFLAYARHYSNPEKLVFVKYDLESREEAEYVIPGVPNKLPPRNSEMYRNPVVILSDGRTILFNRKNTSDDRYALIHHDLVTGTQKEILKSKSRVRVGDDHNHSVLLTVRENSGSQVFLYTFENAELEQKYQVTIPKDFERCGVYWGGPDLILRRKSDQTNKVEAAEIWTLSVTSGKFRKTDISLPNNSNWGNITENGRPLIFRNTIPPSRGIWVMENFLPKKAMVN